MFLFKINLIIFLFLNKIQTKNITLEEAIRTSPIPFIESFCDLAFLRFIYGMRDCRKHYDKGYDCGEGLEIDNSGIKVFIIKK
ncbi:unnamed protein product [Meloidogyne enterolobii]|uniref:Uncharacterized protein n=1 Tax=Meloidogyne enterolobii TaxID=390850 RepID=A0ACB0Z3X1_MELEN